ncbi:MAG: 4Fe-4S binding protein [Candidatus Lokiarchaeota archaeon]|nr:4Fe-4S binding protein [Candidatus Lokiarchaeota archaeon]
MKLRIQLKDHKIILARRIVQIITFLLINYVIIETIFAINLKGFEGLIKVLPILNSPRNPLSQGAGILEYIFYSIANGFFPLFLISVFILFILFTNRSFCGWVCPIGTIQDACAAIPTKKKTIKTKTHKSLLNFKYVFIIILIIFIVPLGLTKNANQLFYLEFKTQLGEFGNKNFGYFSMSEFIFSYFTEFITDWSTIFNSGDWGAIFIFFFYLIILILSIWYPRMYCRYFCPFAALSAVVADYSFLKLSRNPVRCVGRSECGICEKVCPKQIRILDEPFEFFTGNGECNICLTCKEKCPHNAIIIKFGNV